MLHDRLVAVRSIGLAAFVAALAALGCQSSGSAPPAAPPRLVEGDSAAALRLAEQAAALLPGDAAGAAIAVVEDGRASLAFGGRPDFGPETLFELGSITKVVTANLVAQRVLAGAFDLDTGLDRLPGGADIGDGWSGVTLRHLLTHSSGLSGWPPNWGPVRIVFSGGLGDPFATYDAPDLLVGMQKARAPTTGERWVYSNYAFAVLGRVLEQESGTPFEGLARDGFIAPVGMETATLHGWSGPAVAPPLGRRGGTATSWSFSAFAPAGALRGSLRDALALLRHAMAACERDDPVSRATCFAREPAGFPMNADSEMGLGWVRTSRNDATVVWHNGGTGGYSTFLGFSPERRRGVVVLTNVGFLREIDALAIETVARDAGVRAP